jgi:hypothetical protein
MRSHIRVSSTIHRHHRAGWRSGDVVDMNLETVRYPTGTSATLNVVLHDFLHTLHANIGVVPWLGVTTVQAYSHLSVKHGLSVCNITHTKKKKTPWS